MEDFGARDWAADAFCQARVKECGIFVGLLFDGSDALATQVVAALRNLEQESLEDGGGNVVCCPHFPQIADFWRSVEPLQFLSSDSAEPYHVSGQAQRRQLQPALAARRG